MSDRLSEEAWKALVLQHYKQPRYFGAVEPHRYVKEEHNRTCGDRVQVFACQLQPDSECLSFQFTGTGCSLSIASASLMVEMLQNVDRSAASKILSKFQDVRAHGAAEGDESSWQVISALRQYPVRSRCVCLAWQALEKILEEWSGGHMV